MNNEQIAEQQHQLLFIYTETPLHAGSGRGLGTVDLPIQRERVTDYPMVQGSSLKGRLRAQVRTGQGWQDDSDELTALFGKADEGNQSFAGAIAPGDARLLLLPVRSLQGVFAWVTSLDVLARFQRDALAVGFPAFKWKFSDEPAENECWAGSSVTFNSQVTLEEFTYTAKTHQAIKQIGEWLAKNALPPLEAAPEYEYWRSHLPNHLVILRREDFRDFARHGTEIRTHVRLLPDTKTVQSGALWTVESLPSDALLYAPVVISDSRAQVEQKLKASAIATTLRNVLNNKRTHLGGDETTGQGIVMIHFCRPDEVKINEVQ